jgi:hypothetical protein
MTATVDGLRLRRIMGRKVWGVPEPFGPDGWRMVSLGGRGSVIVTTSDVPGDPYEWTHASIAYQTVVPTYEELCRLKEAVWGDDGYAYQVFVPVSEHVNIHEFALHLWGRADGAPVLPEFTRLAGVKSI